MTRLRNGYLCRLGCEWFKDAGPSLPDPQPNCTGVLPLYFYANRPGFGESRIGIQISGRARVGPFTSGGTVNCGSTDAYVWQSFYGKNPQYCDIWKAFTDGIWTSSVTIDVFALAVFPSGTVLEVFAGDNYTAGGPLGAQAGTLLASKAISRPSYSTACGSTALVATFTLNDDGSASIV